jgi:hypothetical protein
MIKKILNWNDRRFIDLLDNDDSNLKNGAKAFGIGALEGFIDAAAVVGAVVIIKDTVYLIKNIVKK